jgi:hypothetical protein
MEIKKSYFAFMLILWLLHLDWNLKSDLKSNWEYENLYRKQNKKRKEKKKNSPNCARGLNLSLSPCNSCAIQLEALTDGPHPSYVFSPHPHTRTPCLRHVGPARQPFSTPHASISASPTHVFPWIADERELGLHLFPN